MAAIAHSVAQLGPARAFRQLPPDRRDQASRERLLARVRGEFEDLRGLHLTFAQAQRLFGMREDVCRRVLATLIRERVLDLDCDAQYSRRTFLPE